MTSALCSFLRRGMGECSADLSSLGQWEWSKLHQGMLRLDLKKHFFPDREVAHWNKLPRVLANNPYLSVLKKSMPFKTLIFGQP